MQRGGHSKDAWVLWDSPVDTFSMLCPRSEPVALRRESPGVPSSVADNVFWLGRYVERAEYVSRIVRSMISRVRRANQAELGCLIRLHGCLDSRQSKLRKTKRKRTTSLEFEQELISLISDTRRHQDCRIRLLGKKRSDCSPRIKAPRDSKPTSSDLSRRASSCGRSLPHMHCSRFFPGGRYEKGFSTSPHVSTRTFALTQKLRMSEQLPRRFFGNGEVCARILRIFKLPASVL
jgi:hypothetical protein